MRDSSRPGDSATDANHTAKQFAIDNLSGLCQELVAWGVGVAPLADGLLAQLAHICEEYCESSDQEKLAAVVESVVIQTALLYAAGAHQANVEVYDQVKHGFTLSVGMDRPTH
ncbi:hypothetical protein [Pseudomonas saliphila]|uniref:hypothetical protein n=1 Tax=Pseudomonas saliphila TaxID=2586906 RepID=UPI00123953FC|nr:hypothetical protein [Pseudomonas saliphila]